MRRAAAILLALSLGLASAFLVACGDRNKLLPQSDASAINQKLDSVASAVAAHDCTNALDAVNAAERQAESVPGKVDPKLQATLQANLEREVAVKLLAEHLADDDNFVSRFRREALAAARLVHPNIVQVFDFGLDDPTGQHYIVMEYVEGQSCAEILREHRRLPVDEVLPIISQSCRGLDHAHRNGVVHRDVKPGNLLRAYDGVVKLADLGIAKATEQSSITQVGSVLGTAAYLAPEQARGEEAGPPADQYALGVVTYQMLAGRLPYEATSLTELAFKQQREVPPPLHELNPELPVALGHAVARSMALDAGARFPSSLAMGVA